MTHTQTHPLWFNAWVLGTREVHQSAAQRLEWLVRQGDDQALVLPSEQRVLPHPFHYPAFGVGVRSFSAVSDAPCVPATFLVEHFKLDAAQRVLAQEFPQVSVAVCAQDRSRRHASELERSLHVAALIMLWSPPQMPRCDNGRRPDHFQNDIPDLARPLTFCFSDTQVSDAARDDPASLMSTGVWMTGGPIGSQLTQWLQAQERALALEQTWSGSIRAQDMQPSERL